MLRSVILQAKGRISSFSNRGVAGLIPLAGPSRAVNNGGEFGGEIAEVKVMDDDITVLAPADDVIMAIVSIDDVTADASGVS